jgi:hypothetical protein
MPKKNDLSKNERTIDHDMIRSWADHRGGHPACIRTNESKTGGILRIDFGKKEKNLEPIEWSEFFDIFDGNGLAFLYREEVDGEKNRFFKFVRRNDTPGVSDRVAAIKKEKKSNTDTDMDDQVPDEEA